MENDAVIADARVEPGSRTIPRARVVVRIRGFEGFQTLFRFYDDELTFTASEFIGLSVSDAHDLFTRKDLAYLLS